MKIKSFVNKKKRTLNIEISLHDLSILAGQHPEYWDGPDAPNMFPEVIDKIAFGKLVAKTLKQPDSHTSQSIIENALYQAMYEVEQYGPFKDGLKRGEEERVYLPS